MNLRTLFKISLIFLVFACENKEEKFPYYVCNEILAITCDGTGYGEFCTFGFKWGDNNPFDNAGLNKPGPSVAAVNISYKFMDAGYVFNTHSESNIVSLSFDNFIPYSKQKIREAFSEWESHAAISFIEDDDAAVPDIKIMLANIRPAGIGYTSFTEEPCIELSGMLIINPKIKFTRDSFYCLVLHEIGHVLGLGHVKSNNIMNPDQYYPTLQPGDIKGIKSIYGEK